MNNASLCRFKRYLVVFFSLKTYAMDSNIHNDKSDSESDGDGVGNKNVKTENAEERNLENYDAEINSLANQARSNILPVKSKALYEAQYIKFKKWCEQKKIEAGNTDERILLAYFQFLSQSYVATTLWATYSKLKSMLLLKENLDISKYLELQCMLKKKEKTHEVKKSKVFTNQEISTFLKEAPDDQFLLHKIVLIFGLHGCLRKTEILNIKIDDVIQHGTFFHVLIPHTKTNESKSFFTSEEMYPMIHKYIQLRPEGMERFFLQYRNKTCTRQVVGKGKLGNIPKEIAKFLNLPNADLYTGHAFRRTSATLIVDEGANLTTLKRHGVWKSNTVAEGYINESVKNKKKISQLISSAIGLNQNLHQRDVPTISKENNRVVINTSLNTQPLCNGALSTKSKLSQFQASSSTKPKMLKRNLPLERNSTDMGLRTPKLCHYQYQPKVYARAVLYDKNRNTSLHTQTSSQVLPSTSKAQINELIQIQTDEYENITQEELTEIVSTDFSDGSRSEDKIKDVDNITQEKLMELVSTDFTDGSRSNDGIENIDNITQEELQEVISTQFEIEYSQISKSNYINRKENQKMLLENLHDIAQEESEEVATTDFLGNKITKNRPIYIFKNCSITINNK